MPIKRYQPESVSFIPEGCYVTELTTAADDAARNIARARVSAGVTTRRHRLRGTVERCVILEGQGEMEAGDAAPVPVHPMDVVTIPASNG